MSLELLTERITTSKNFMINEFTRTEMLFGKKAMEKFKNSNILIFGVGGVGSYTASALARSGIYNFTIVDGDSVSITNINRQLVATHKTIGKQKAEVMKEIILDINPKANVKAYNLFYKKDCEIDFFERKYDYIIDAVDMITAKIDIIINAKKAKIPIISSMGAGNKLDPTKFEVTDIFKTSVCPLAKVMRKELKKREILDLKVVYSKEEPIIPKNAQEIIKEENIAKRQVPASCSFVPSVCGLIIAGEVLKDISKQ